MDEKMKVKVWEKAKKIDGYNSNMIRQDMCGAWIVYEEYGNRESSYGWEIDHTYPISMGGDDNEANLRPMNWQNNMSKGDDYPIYLAAVSAEGNENVEMPNYMRINEKIQEELKRLYK